MAVKVKGLDKAFAELDKQEDIVIEAVKDILSSTATDIEIQAGNAAPSSYQIGDYIVDLRFIRQKINKDVFENGLLFKVGINVPSQGEQWEAWMEFGTGLSAQQILAGAGYTPEIKAQAENFKRNGKGRIIGRPYFYPAFFRNTANLVTEIEAEIIKDLK